MPTPSPVALFGRGGQCSAPTLSSDAENCRHILRTVAKMFCRIRGRSARPLDAGSGGIRGGQKVITDWRRGRSLKRTAVGANVACDDRSAAAVARCTGAPDSVYSGAPLHRPRSMAVAAAKQWLPGAGRPIVMCLSATSGHVMFVAVVGT
jgi:hypothetical protein